MGIILASFLFGLSVAFSLIVSVGFVWYVRSNVSPPKALLTDYTLHTVLNHVPVQKKAMYCSAGCCKF